MITKARTILKSLGGSLAMVERKWWWGRFALLAASFLFVFLFVFFFTSRLISMPTSVFYATLATNKTNIVVPVNSTPPASTRLPRLAYLVSGTKGDLDRLWRTLLSLYHPRNQYVVHLELESPVAERKELRRRVAEVKVFQKVGNVHVIDKANMVTYRGPTMVANTLHACAILLRKSKDWDWFINLSASDYPLATQDDILYIFSKVKRNLNFMEYTSNLGWKKMSRAIPLIVDPGLYNNRKSNIFWVSQKRELPTSFKLFTGSAWMALTREFVEYCIWGWDNLPRTLLMYYTNFVSSPEGYFQTVICNAPYFNSTVVNHDLHFISWDNPPRQHPRTLSMKDNASMIASGAPFARKFPHNGTLLDQIDAELLGRSHGGFTPGAWCKGKPKCSVVGDANKIRPGPGSKRIIKLVEKVIRSTAKNPCR